MITIECSRDVCVRENCPAKNCTAKDCFPVCREYNRYSAACDRLSDKYSLRRNKFRGDKFKSFTDEQKKVSILQQQKYNYELEQLKNVEFRHVSRVFQPCGHTFDVPDDTPRGSLVICPFCGGENRVPVEDKDNESDQMEFGFDGKITDDSVIS